MSPKKKAPVKLTLKGPETNITGMCMGQECKTKRNMVTVLFYKNPNGSVRVAGKCNKCGTNMNTFVSGGLFK